MHGLSYDNKDTGHARVLRDLRVSHCILRCEMVPRFLREDSLVCCFHLHACLIIIFWSTLKADTAVSWEKLVIIGPPVDGSGNPLPNRCCSCTYLYHMMLKDNVEIKNVFLSGICMSVLPLTVQLLNSVCE